MVFSCRVAVAVLLVRVVRVIARFRRSSVKLLGMWRNKCVLAKLGLLVCGVEEDSASYKYLNLKLMGVLSTHAQRSDSTRWLTCGKNLRGFPFLVKYPLVGCSPLLNTYFVWALTYDINMSAFGFGQTNWRAYAIYINVHKYDNYVLFSFCPHCLWKSMAAELSTNNLMR